MGLSQLYRKLLIEGFTAPDGKGNRVRLRLRNNTNRVISSISGLSEIDLSQEITPLDIARINEVAIAELSNLQTAEKVMTSLQYAIDGLTERLKLEARDEESLQAWLTENPILFGTDYKRVIPKFKLGTEFITDYILEKHNGMYDFVEIESSMLPIYTKTSNPTSHLVHAEQQIMDWLDWVERNSSYARTKLENIVSPIGYVVIGRSNGFNGKHLQMLKRRNIMFGGRIEIMTYDDILAKATNLVNVLTSSNFVA